MLGSERASEAKSPLVMEGSWGDGIWGREQKESHAGQEGQTLGSQQSQVEVHTRVEAGEGAEGARQVRREGQHVRQLGGRWGRGMSPIIFAAGRVERR